MNSRIRKIKDRFICKFLAVNYEDAGSEVHIDRIDLLERFESYREDNAWSYTFDSDEVIRMVPEMFPNAKIQDTRVCGISRRPKAVKPVKHVPTKEEQEDMVWRGKMDGKFKRYIDSRGLDCKTIPIDPVAFAADRQAFQAGSSIVMVCRECSVEDARRYLSGLEFLFFNESDGCWHFHRKE